MPQGSHKSMSLKRATLLNCLSLEIKEYHNLLSCHSKQSGGPQEEPQEREFHVHHRLRTLAGTSFSVLKPYRSSTLCGYVLKVPARTLSNPTTCRFARCRTRQRADLHVVEPDTFAYSTCVVLFHKRHYLLRTQRQLIL